MQPGKYVQKRFMNGGAEKKNQQNQKKRYDSLAVPFGLFVSSVGAASVGVSQFVTGGSASQYAADGGTISDELFDELISKAQ